MTQIETEIEVKYKTTLGDSCDENLSGQDIKDLVEEHINEFCEENGIHRSDIFCVFSVIYSEKVKE